jgi:hypothetical protein
MHVTNGIAKDVTNNDYVVFKNAQTQNGYVFGGANTSRPLSTEMIQLLRKNLDQYGSVKTDNYFFHNNGNLTFSNTTVQTGLATPSISNGAAYADLDNDGDLDLVTNNMNQPASVWRNETRTSVKDSAFNFITIQLIGSPGNMFVLGINI